MILNPCRPMVLSVFSCYDRLKPRLCSEEAHYASGRLPYPRVSVSLSQETLRRSTKALNLYRVPAETGRQPGSHCGAFYYVTRQIFYRSPTHRGEGNVSPCSKHTATWTARSPPGAINYYLWMVAGRSFSHLRIASCALVARYIVAVSGRTIRVNLTIPGNH